MAESDSERLKLTPEQRRFLGGARSANPPQPSTEQKPPRPEPVPKPTGIAPPVSPTSTEPSPPAPEHRKPHRVRKLRFSKAFEIQYLALVVGGVVLLGATFYIGKKFEYWHY